MSNPLEAHEHELAVQIGDWAGRIYVSHERGEQKARNAAETLAEDITNLTMWNLPKRYAFRMVAAKIATRYVRNFS